jgi:hypothetical protein
MGSYVVTKDEESEREVEPRVACMVGPRCGVGVDVHAEGQRRRRDGGRRRAVMNRNGEDLFLFRGQAHLRVSDSRLKRKK